MEPGTSSKTTGNACPSDTWAVPREASPALIPKKPLRILEDPVRRMGEKDLCTR